MRQVIVAANWKMNTTPADAGELARTIGSRTREPGVIRIFCPPYVCLAAVRDALAGPGLEAADGSGVAVGAQNVHHEPAGAFTGEVSAAMLAGLASWVIVGHSERRRDAAETDELIGRKLRAARAAGLRTILCVGEQLDEREAGRAEAVVAAQVRGCLAGTDLASLGSEAGLPWLTIAYEPVWAIGTGRTARGGDAAAMAVAIRSALATLGMPGDGQAIPILYGGSVTSASIGEFLAEPDIDGALVGGASLKPDEMAGIVARAGLTAAARRMDRGPGGPAASGASATSVA
ncbi:MAG TPA: triose-phosphate isomerase [Candidatus Limnocylindrales bacterium]|jgi:triosephosphate isomerase